MFDFGILEDVENMLRMFWHSSTFPMLFDNVCFGDVSCRVARWLWCISCGVGPMTTSLAPRNSSKLPTKPRDLLLPVHRAPPALAPRSERQGSRFGSAMRMTPWKFDIFEIFEITGSFHLLDFHGFAYVVYIITGDQTIRCTKMYIMCLGYWDTLQCDVLCAYCHNLSQWCDYERLPDWPFHLLFPKLIREMSRQISIDFLSSQEFTAQRKGKLERHRLFLAAEGTCFNYSSQLSLLVEKITGDAVTKYDTCERRLNKITDV